MTTRYKGCTISRSNASTTVLRSNGSLASWEVTVPLYDIEGAVTKPHGLRPFITSIADAKRYITEKSLSRARIWDVRV